MARLEQLVECRHRIAAGEQSPHRFEHLLVRVIRTLDPANRAELAGCMSTPGRYERRRVRRLDRWQRGPLRRRGENSGRFRVGHFGYLKA